MEEHSTRATAYPGSEAVVYDENRFTDEGGQRIHELELQKVLDASQELSRGSSIAEIGCGTGRLLVEFNARGFSLHGVDASADMIAQPRSKFEPNVAPVFRVASAHETGFDPDTFDFVYSVRLLNQTESPEYALTVIEEIARIAKPGAKVVVEYIPERRPALGGASRDSVRLRADDVRRTAELAGLRVDHFRGSFILGMQAFKASPKALFPILNVLDRLGDRFIPTACARVYLTATKLDK